MASPRPVCCLVSLDFCGDGEFFVFAFLLVRLSPLTALLLATFGSLVLMTGADLGCNSMAMPVWSSVAESKSTSFPDGRMILCMWGYNIHMSGYDIHMWGYDIHMWGYDIHMWGYDIPAHPQCTQRAM